MYVCTCVYRNKECSENYSFLISWYLSVNITDEGETEMSFLQYGILRMKHAKWYIAWNIYIYIFCC